MRTVSTVTQITTTTAPAGMPNQQQVLEVLTTRRRAELARLTTKRESQRVVLEVPTMKRKRVVLEGLTTQRRAE
jgi:hypothetical protein